MKGRIALAALGLGLCAVLVVVSGIVPIAASSGHWGVTEWFLHFAMQRSVATHSVGVEAPPLDDSRLRMMGAGHYESGCRPCHGAPGNPAPVVPQQMTPHPPDLSARVKEYDDAELFYIVRHGVKFTGMPAWPAQKRGDEVWAMVAFLRELPKLDRQSYRWWVYGDARKSPARADQAPAAVIELCARCHGVDGLGRGTGAFPRLANQRPEYLRASLRAYARGQRHSGIMQPIAAALDEESITDVVRWYASVPPVSGSERAADKRADAKDRARGARIARRGIPHRRIPACSHCHGPGRKPYRDVYPKLTGQYVAYLEQQLRLFVGGQRGGTAYAEIMHTVAAHGLESEEIRAVSRYYGSLPPSFQRAEEPHPD